MVLHDLRRTGYRIPAELRRVGWRVLEDDWYGPLHPDRQPPSVASIEDLVSHLRLLPARSFRERSISGHERHRRAVEHPWFPLGAMTALALCKSYGSEAAWWPRAEHGPVQCIYFDGTLLREPGGQSCIIAIGPGPFGSLRWYPEALRVACGPAYDFSAFCAPG